MFGNKKQKASNRIDSLIGLETRIEGHVQFAGGLRVDGQIIGDVSTQEGQASTLIVSEKALVRGAIRVGHLVLNGTVEGPIYATDYVELQSKCRVTGDVHYATLEMHPGAIVEGNLIHVASGKSGGGLSGLVSSGASSAEMPPAEMRKG